LAGIKKEKRTKERKNGRKKERKKEKNLVELSTHSPGVMLVAGHVALSIRLIESPLLSSSPPVYIPPPDSTNRMISTLIPPPQSWNVESVSAAKDLLPRRMDFIVYSTFVVLGFTLRPVVVL
jgi:hypothetical protein